MDLFLSKIEFYSLNIKTTAMKKKIKYNTDFQKGLY